MADTALVQNGAWVWETEVAVVWAWWQCVTAWKYPARLASLARPQACAASVVELARQAADLGTVVQAADQGVVMAVAEGEG